MLPSDIARLVLVYLKEEGLSRAYHQFFKDSPHLEELRQHPGVEPSVPHEKGLQEILTEYVKIVNAIKEKLSSNQLVNNLWKMHNEVTSQLRYHYIGNAGLLQVSPENRQVTQGVRSRQRLTGLRKQQELQRKLAAQLSDSASSNSDSLDHTPAHPATYPPISSTHLLIGPAQSRGLPTQAVSLAQPGLGPAYAVLSPAPLASPAPSATPAPSVNPALSVNLTPLVNPAPSVNSAPSVNLALSVNSALSIANTASLVSPAPSVNPAPSVANPAHSFISSAPSLANPAHSVPGSAQTVVISSHRLVNTAPAIQADAQVGYGRSQGGIGAAVQQNLPRGIEVEIPAGARADAERSRQLQALQETEFRTPVKNRSGANLLDTPTGKSPKRKSAAPRRMQSSAATVVSPQSDVASASASSASAVPSEEEVRDLPEVLESLINNIEFQEKLAQNINRARPLESIEREGPVEPIREADSGPQHADQSASTIEELLNLHMSDNTIQDIVQKTSSDPAFESLFSLFSQNSQDSYSHQFNPVSELCEETTQPSIGTEAGQSSPPDPSHSGQSQRPADGQVTRPPANQIGGGIAVTTGIVSSGHAAGAGSQAVAATSRVPFHVVPESTPTSLGTPPPNSPATTMAKTTTSSSSQVVTIPLVLNQAGVVGVAGSGGGVGGGSGVGGVGTLATLQLAGGMEPSSLGLQGGTIFMTPDGQILGTAAMPLLPQNSQSLRPDAANSPSDACPVHGKKAVRGAPGTDESPAAASVDPGGGNNEGEIVKLLGSMVESDIGAMLSCSSERLQPRSLPSAVADWPFRGLGSADPGSTDDDRSSGSAVAGNPPCKPPAEAPTDSSPQSRNESRNLFSAMTSGSSPAAGTPGPAAASEVSPNETAPAASNGVKQRKHIQHKKAFMSRPLDFGESCSAADVKGQLHVPAGQQQVSKTRGQRRRSRPAAHQSPAPSAEATAGKRPPFGLPLKTSDPNTASISVVPARPKGLETVDGGDMSVEVNIAAQMLVCLSNSPPSLRSSPLRRQQRSAGSPARSPARDHHHIAELRREIGLTPRAGRLQARPRDDPPPGPDRGEDRGGAGRKEPPSSEQAAGKRKSKPPQRHTHPVTETVVAAVASQDPPPPPRATPGTKTPSKTRGASHKGRSPGRSGDEAPQRTRKSPRRSKSPGWPANLGAEERGAGSAGQGQGQAGEARSQRGENRGLKRSREGIGKEEKIRKLKIAKNARKSKKSQGFPSNLDVDKFLSSLQYAE